MWSSFIETLHEPQNWLLVGMVILFGHAGGMLARLCRLPAVVGYLIVGVVMGRSVTDMIDGETAQVLELITDFGLGIVAFVIGAELSASSLRRMGRSLTAILFGQFGGAVLAVFFGVWAFAATAFTESTVAIAAALIFAAVAAATAPAGTVAVIQEYRARGPMTSMLLAVVGLDDGLAIMFYAFAAAVAKVMISGQTISLVAISLGPIKEIAGSLALGAAGGLMLSYVVRRTRSAGEVLSLTLGFVLLVTGIANVLHLSLILSNLAVGMAVANTSSHEAERTASALEGIVHPVYILFFAVAGAHLHLKVLLATGLLVPVYIVGRSVGKMSGAYLGALAGRAEPVMRRYLGLGLLPQAGVAVGLALMAAQQLSATGTEEGRRLAVIVINTITASTIFFEVLGPVATKMALVRAGEIEVRGEAATGDTPDGAVGRT